MNTILYGAAAVLIVFALVSASSGGGGTLLLLVAGAGLIGAAVWRTRSTGETGPAHPRLVDSDLRVTDQDVEKAASFSGTDLTLDEICRLTRPGSAWWSDPDKRAFRVELERRLGDRR